MRQDTVADDLTTVLRAVPEMLDLLEDALPYVEEGEEFNKPTRRDLSKRIKAMLSKHHQGRG